MQIPALGAISHKSTGVIATLGFGLYAQIEKKSFEAVRTGEKIKVDGVLDEPAWQQAAMVKHYGCQSDHE